MKLPLLSALPTSLNVPLTTSTPRSQACGASGQLADAGFDFMKSELTVNDAQQIAAKIKTQPYTPPSLGVAGGDVFPSVGDVAEATVE